MKCIKIALQHLIISALILQPGILLHANAEEPDFSDTGYWNSLCTGDDLSEEDAASCRAYMQYMQSQNQKLQEEIANIDARKQEIAANISSYSQQIDAYNAQIAGINSMIQDLNAQITAVEEQVADIEAKIKANEKAIREQETKIEELRRRVSDRMEEQQKTMRFYQFLDVIMGAASFDDFVRLVNGVNSIFERDSYSLQTLNESIDQLNQMKDELLQDQEEVKNMEAELELGREALATQQAALLSSRYELDLIKQSYSEQMAQAESARSDAQSAIDANKGTMDEIEEAIKTTPTPGTTPSGDDGKKDSEPSGGGSDPVPSGGGETPVPSGGENPYYGGWSNCTWGAWQLVHDTLGISLPGWGMAGNWISDAQRSGYATGSSPKVYSIAVYSWHVAFVTAVDGDRIYIKEGNYMGHYYERWVPADGLPYTGQSCLGYIYL